MRHRPLTNFDEVTPTTAPKKTSLNQCRSSLMRDHPVAVAVA